MSLERLLGYIHNEAGGKGSPEHDENIQHTNNLCSTYAHLNFTLPADWYDHGVVFDLFELASVLESL